MTRPLPLKAHTHIVLAQLLAELFERLRRRVEDGGAHKDDDALPARGVLAVLERERGSLERAHKVKRATRGLEPVEARDELALVLRRRREEVIPAGQGGERR